ncbi:MAG TPA: hypothetical protein DEQ47_09135 [Solibacterales bacterium]|nr:hypothetical protein [Bryobacterales bacterium]
MSETTPTIPVAYCRTCGKALYEAPRRTETGAAYCEEHFPAAEFPASGPAASTAPPPPPPPSGFKDSAYSGQAGAYGSVPPFSDAPRTAYAAADAGPQPYRQTPSYGLSSSPPLAFLLGFIPGVGAIYNAQYAKGLVHAVTFGLLVSILNNDVGRGMEPLVGILLAAFIFYMAFEAYHTARKRRDGEAVDEFSSLIGGGSARFPAAGLALIGLGVLLLLMTNDLISAVVLRRAWPLALVAVGGYLLYTRTRQGKSE